MKNFSKKIIDDVSVLNKRIIVRVDYNVPLEKNGQIADDERIRSSVPTIQDLIKRGAKQIVLISHLGRPDRPDKNLSLLKTAERLAELIDEPVDFETDFSVLRSDKRIVMYENLRFDPGEVANSIEFAQKLVNTIKPDLFVQDGFSVCHRVGASTVAITKLLPSVASRKLALEYSAIQDFVSKAKSPILAIIGGAKISDKIDFVKKIVELSDQVVIGGAIANIFLKYDGIEVGSSLIEPGQESEIEAIKEIIGDKVFVLPEDIVVGDDLNYKSGDPRMLSSIGEGEMILDIGAKTQQRIRDLIKDAGCVIWNGNLGYTENSIFQSGTSAVIDALEDYRIPALIGGGDTIGFLNQFNPDLAYSGLYISTAGGAMLDLIANGNMVGVDSLLDASFKLK